MFCSSLQLFKFQQRVEKIMGHCLKSFWFSQLALNKLQFGSILTVINEHENDTELSRNWYNEVDLQQTLVDLELWPTVKVLKSYDQKFRK